MTDKLLELEALAPRIADALIARSLGEHLERAKRAVSEAPRQTQRFAALVDTALLLNAATSPNAKRDLEEAFDCAEDLGGLLGRAMSGDDLQNVAHSYPDFANAIRDLERVVRQLWIDVADREYRSLISVGELLVSIERTRELGGRFVETGRAAVALAQRPGPAEQLAPEVKRLQQQRDALEAELHAFTHDEAVDAFLKAVTTHRATLADVTPAVLDWLAENGALQAFAVRGR